MLARGQWLAAKRAALLELADWNRFRVLPDRRRADLIFLLSANPYLGDYLTRDGPDTRPVSVNVTFMNVIDPGTGENLWGECRRWGSWRVPEATRDLIADFRKQLNAEEEHIDQALFVNEDRIPQLPSMEVSSVSLCTERARGRCDSCRCRSMRSGYSFKRSWATATSDSR